MSTTGHYVIVDADGDYIDDDELPQNYEIFAWLAGVRNHAGIEPLARPRGLPENVDQHDLENYLSVYEPFGYTWYTLAELVEAIDKDLLYENRRSGNDTLPYGKGKPERLKYMLGGRFCALMHNLHTVYPGHRIIFFFE